MIAQRIGEHRPAEIAVGAQRDRPAVPRQRRHDRKARRDIVVAQIGLAVIAQPRAHRERPLFQLRLRPGGISAREIGNRLASARRGDEQNRWLMWSAIGGVVVGMMLWAVFAGIVARAVPASWQWPEKMAARSLDLPMWEGGQHLMRASAPDAFANIAAGDRIVTANRQALEACRKRADKAREAVRCTIKIEPEARR